MLQDSVSDSVFSSVTVYFQFLIPRVGFLFPKEVFTTRPEFWQLLYSQERNVHFQCACDKLSEIIPGFLHVIYTVNLAICTADM